VKCVKTTTNTKNGTVFIKLIVFCVISIATKYRFHPLGMRSTSLLQFSGASLNPLTTAKPIDWLERFWL